jgi:hypothetical protein
MRKKGNGISIIDVVAILTDSPNPRDYWYRIKQREKISGIELSTICRQFKLAAQDGKLRETDCAEEEEYRVQTITFFLGKIVGK